MYLLYTVRFERHVCAVMAVSGIHAMCAAKAMAPINHEWGNVLYAHVEG